MYIRKKTKINCWVRTFISSRVGPARRQEPGGRGPAARAAARARRRCRWRRRPPRFRRRRRRMACAGCCGGLGAPGPAGGGRAAERCPARAACGPHEVSWAEGRGSGLAALAGRGGGGLGGRPGSVGGWAQATQSAGWVRRCARRGSRVLEVACQCILQGHSCFCERSIGPVMIRILCF